MKQFNLEQKVFAELLLEQSQKEIEVDIVVKQIIAGKSESEIRQTWKKSLDTFKKQRSKC